MKHVRHSQISEVVLQLRGFDNSYGCRFRATRDSAEDWRWVVSQGSIPKYLSKFDCLILSEAFAEMASVVEEEE